MQTKNIGPSIDRYIRKRCKRKYISLKEIMELVEMWRYEVIFNTMSLYTMCENCGRDHKKDPTANKWMSRMDKP